MNMYAVIIEINVWQYPTFWRYTQIHDIETASAQVLCSLLRGLVALLLYPLLCKASAQGAMPSPLWG